MYLIRFLALVLFSAHTLFSMNTVLKQEYSELHRNGAETIKWMQDGVNSFNEFFPSPDGRQENSQEHIFEDLMYTSGLALRGTGKIEVAIDVLRLLVEDNGCIDGIRALAAYQLGTLFMEEENYGMAREYFELSDIWGHPKAATKFHNMNQILLYIKNKANRALQGGKYDEAIQSFHILLANQVQESEDLAKLGSVYFLSGNKDKADLYWDLAKNQNSSSARTRSIDLYWRQAYQNNSDFRDYVGVAQRLLKRAFPSLEEVD